MCETVPGRGHVGETAAAGKRSGGRRGRLPGGWVVGGEGGPRIVMPGQWPWPLPGQRVGGSYVVADEGQRSGWGPRRLGSGKGSSFAPVEDRATTLSFQGTCT